MTNRFYQALKETWDVVKKHKKESVLIALTSIGMGLQKCADRTPYEYCGMVGQDSVEFRTAKKGGSVFDRDNCLTFYNKGGEVELWDEVYNNLKFENVRILSKGLYEGSYEKRDKEVGKYVVGPWQAKADSVLPKILEIKEQKREQEIQEKEQERQVKIKEGLKYLE